MWRRVLRKSLAIGFIAGVWFWYGIANVPVSLAAGPTVVQSDITTPTVWTKEGSPYVVMSAMRVKAPLTIEPGVVVKFSNRPFNSTLPSIVIANTFTAVGSASERIVFTSVCDKNYGGDTESYAFSGIGTRCRYGYPIAGSWGDIVSFNNPNKVNIDHAVILYAYNGFRYENYRLELPYKEASVRNTEIRYVSWSGIGIINTQPVLDSNTISNCYRGISVNSVLDRIPKIRNSIIVNNSVGLYTVGVGANSVPADVRYNWWGSASGPYYPYFGAESKNLTGTGNIVIGDNVIFRPWLTDPSQKAPGELSCTENCFSNVLFLPGLEASRLYAKDDPSCTTSGCENQLWEPNRNEDVTKLYLDENGKSTNAYDIYTRDALDEIDLSGQNVYKSFIDRMNTMKDADHLINDWAAVPYDWRLSIEDILNGGTSVADGMSYINASSAPHIIEELKRLASTSRTGKVTIVAHSNGGLLAKALMRRIGDEETKKLIDTVVLVAVPQLGTPVALGATLHGYDQDLLGGLILSKSTARGLAEHMPSAYTLLPSAKYFSLVGTPVATFDAEKLPDWSARYGEVIGSRDSMRNFLTDAYERVEATSGDTETPSMLHDNLLDAAFARQDDLDEWTAPEGVKVVQIAGWGVPATVSGMRYTSEARSVCEHGICSAPHDVLTEQPTFTVDGDGTVVTPSALEMGADRYWVDLGKYNRKHLLETVFGLIGINHVNILEIPELGAFISDTITRKVESIDNYTYLMTTAPLYGGNRLQYSLHSPLSLSLYDDQGRHTGVGADGRVEERIPGTYYRQFGEVKYVFADEAAVQHLKLDGYDTGTFTLEVEEFSGDESLGKVTFKDVPTTSDTHVSLDTTDGLGTLSTLRIDEDGDGDEDFHLQPRVGDPVVFDATAPTTTHTLSGTEGKNGWFTSDVTVTLSATDEESGVAETRYSLDGGETWTTYTGPFTITQGNHTDMRYFSRNVHGVAEGVHPVAVAIDRTVPEARIRLDELSRKIDIVGTDDPEGEGLTIDRSAEGFVVSDAAGHTLDIRLSRSMTSGNHASVRIDSIAYDGVVTDTPDIFLKYEFSLDRKKDDAYRTLLGFVRNGAEALQTRYRSDDDTTLLTIKTLSEDDSGEDEDADLVWESHAGMIIPGLRTDKGKLVSYY